MYVELIASLDNFCLINLHKSSFVCIPASRGDMKLLNNMFFLHEILNLIAKVLVTLIALTFEGLDSYDVKIRGTSHVELNESSNTLDFWWLFTCSLGIELNLE